MKSFEAGRYVLLERVKDYWGDHLPVNKGQNNFDFRRIDFYRDSTSIRLALKSGDIDFFFESQAKSWALSYNIPAVKNGLLKKEMILNENPMGMVGFVITPDERNFLKEKSEGLFPMPSILSGSTNSSFSANTHAPKAIFPTPKWRPQDYLQVKN